LVVSDAAPGSRQIDSLKTSSKSLPEKRDWDPSSRCLSRFLDEKQLKSQRRSLMRKAIGLALSLALLATIAGCGSKDSGSAPADSAPGGSTAAAPGAPSSPAPSPAPSPGGATPPGMPSGPPGMAGMTPPGAPAAPEAAKAAETAAADKPAPKKDDDDSDDPFGPEPSAAGGKKTVTGALGNALLKLVPGVGGGKTGQ
jgi:hypothetical protein